MILNLDLDGVFSDMAGSVKNLTGFEYHTNPERAWDIVDKHYNFFLHLKPLEGSLKLFKFIRASSVYPSRILTALPMLTNQLKSAERDKRVWVAEYLDTDIEVICVKNWSYKKDYCSAGDILVDDSVRNIIDWTEAGGIGVLHNNPIDTLGRLKELNVFGRK